MKSEVKNPSDLSEKHSLYAVVLAQVLAFF